MNISSEFKYIFIILIAFVILQACNNPSGANEESSKGANLSTSGTPAQQWLVNLNDAYAQSVKDKKPVLAYFTSSDTCGQCKLLETDVFSSTVFREWAEKRVVLFQVDFSTIKKLPIGNQEQNTAMAQSLKVASYPTIWMLNVTHEVENGRFKVKPIGFSGYQPSPEKLIGVLQNFVRR